MTQSSREDGSKGCFPAPIQTGELRFVGPLSNAASYQSIPELYDASGKWKVNRLPPGVNAEDVARYSSAVVPRTTLKFLC